MRVATLNVWHGLDTRGVLRFPEELGESKTERVDHQLRTLSELGPDLVFLQEVNRLPMEARRYSEALGYQEVHQVASCGIHLGPLRIPRNVNAGLAILARPGLELRRLRSKRLSGSGCCRDHVGVQWNETRYLLLAEITHAGHHYLVANTHLHSSQPLPPDFDQRLGDLVATGIVTSEQRRHIETVRDVRVARRLRETRRALHAIERQLERRTGRYRGVILGGDLNSEPGSAALTLLVDGGFSLSVLESATSHLATVDPERNRTSEELASGRGALPDFDLAEVRAIYEEARSRPRTLDYILVRGLDVRAARRFLDQPIAQAASSRFGSDHYGWLVDLEPAHPALP